MLISVMPCLSDQNLSAAMSVLVPGGFVELTMGHMAKAGPGEFLGGFTLFDYFTNDPGARERLCKPEMVDQLTPWVVKWLKEVRPITSRQALGSWCCENTQR
jgi:hypothetical protein